MKYPYGYRESLAAACTAASESASLTKVRYFVYLRRWNGNPNETRRLLKREFVFMPKDDPGPNHEAVRL